jgi:hypothetical protein
MQSKWPWGFLCAAVIEMVWLLLLAWLALVR